MEKSFGPICVMRLLERSLKMISAMIDGVRGEKYNIFSIPVCMKAPRAMGNWIPYTLVMRLYDKTLRSVSIIVIALVLYSASRTFSEAKAACEMAAM